MAVGGCGTFKCTEKLWANGWHLVAIAILRDRSSNLPPLPHFLHSVPCVECWHVCIQLYARKLILLAEAKEDG